MESVKTTTRTALMLAAVLAAAHNVGAQCVSGNCYDGYGVYQDDKIRYIGFFDNGNPNGHGVLYFAGGDCYIGNFKDKKFDKKGTYFFADDGARQIGYFTNGMKNGPVEEITLQGKSYHDFYVDNELLQKNIPTKGTLYGDPNNGYSMTIFEDGTQYEGYNRDGKHNGWGTLTKFDGSVYVGEFVDDQFNGYGQLTTPDGEVKEGMWENNRYAGELKNQIGCVSGDCMNSYSVLIENGEKYIGEFKNGRPHGMGKFILPNGSVYTGSVVNGKIDGMGTMVYADDGNPISPARYVGDIKGGQPNGFGAVLYRNGDIYYGQLVNNVFSGQGVYYEKATDSKKSGLYRNGSLALTMPEQELDLIFGDKEGFGLKLTETGRYAGNLMAGEPNGQGMLETYDGRLIIGEFEDGMANGQGFCENNTTGNRYIGQMRNNKMTGRGTMFYANGTKQKGYFKDGQLAQETVEARIAKPVVSWTAPQNYSMDVTEGTFVVKLCVNSTVPIDEVSISDNGVVKVNKATRGYAMKNSMCDYAFEFEIPIDPGRNEIKAMVKNEGGSTYSEPRYVNRQESDAVSSQARLALIIGNSDYQFVGKLPNAANDATLMAGVLKSLGFETMVYTDADRNKIKNAVYDFGERLTETKGVGLFFYAGHGIQVDGVNYLVPVSAQLNRREDVEDVCFSINKLLGQMEYAANDLNIVILDACRDDPFAATASRAVKSSGGGLAQLNAPKGTFIAYSTAPGKTASDGTGKNGLYTEQLAKAIKTPGYKIEDVFKQVRNEVFRISHDLAGDGNEQIPWENSSIFGDFYFLR